MNDERFLISDARTVPTEPGCTLVRSNARSTLLVCPVVWCLFCVATGSSIDSLGHVIHGIGVLSSLLCLAIGSTRWVHLLFAPCWLFFLAEGLVNVLILLGRSH